MSVVYKLTGLEISNESDGEYQTSDLNSCHNILKRYIRETLNTSGGYYNFIISNKAVMKNFKLIWEHGEIDQLIQFWNQIADEDIRLAVSQVESKQEDIPFPFELD